MKKVFLGGTTSSSNWREDLIPLLKIDHFNPVVEHWTQDCKIEEEKQKKECDFILFVITRTYSMYSIAEAVDLSNKYPHKTIFCFVNEETPRGKMSFSRSNLGRLDMIGKIIEANGGKCFESLEDVADYLNKEAL